MLLLIYSFIDSFIYLRHVIIQGSFSFVLRLDTEHVLSENLKMAFFKCNSEDKLALLYHLLQHVISDQEQTVIFAATKHHVEYLHLVGSLPI